MQLPFAGIIAPTMVTELAEVVRVPDVPVQVVVGDGDVAMTRLAGTVSAKWDCVRSKPLALVKMMVRVEATFSPTLVGEKVSLTAGEIGAKVSGVGHAVAAVPADDGALLLVTPLVATATVAVSVFAAESVTVKVNVPAAPLKTTVACGVKAPD